LRCLTTTLSATPTLVFSAVPGTANLVFSCVGDSCLGTSCLHPTRHNFMHHTKQLTGSFHAGPFRRGRQLAVAVSCWHCMRRTVLRRWAAPSHSGPATLCLLLCCRGDALCRSVIEQIHTADADATAAARSVKWLLHKRLVHPAVRMLHNSPRHSEITALCRLWLCHAAVTLDVKQTDSAFLSSCCAQRIYLAP